MLRPYECGRAERADKGNAIVTGADGKNSGGDQFDRIQRRDKFATDYDLLQIVAIAKFHVIEKPNPKIRADLICLRDFEDGGIEHGRVFSSGYATAAFGGNPKLPNPKSQTAREPAGASIRWPNFETWDLGFGASRGGAAGG